MGRIGFLSALVTATLLSINAYAQTITGTLSWQQPEDERVTGWVLYHGTCPTPGCRVTAKAFDASLSNTKVQRVNIPIKDTTFADDWYSYPITIKTGEKIWHYFWMTSRDDYGYQSVPCKMLITPRGQRTGVGIP